MNAYWSGIIYASAEYEYLETSKYASLVALVQVHILKINFIYCYSHYSCDLFLSPQ